jgi:uncharacterized protein (DUF1330 family)
MIFQVTIRDHERHDNEIFPKVLASIQAHNVKVLSVDDGPEVLHGEDASMRVALLEFRDKDHAMAWYNSPEFQEVMKADYDNAHSVDQALLLSGLSGEQQNALLGSETSEEAPRAEAAEA